MTPWVVVWFFANRNLPLNYLAIFLAPQFNITFVIHFLLKLNGTIF
jgi:hypothetical protein